jgi:metallo-beta-lactamase class B
MAKTIFRRIVFLVSLIVLVPVMAGAQKNPDWHRAIAGFKIAGNLYYVGTADLAVYLISTPQGHIRINSDFKHRGRTPQRTSAPTA